MARPLQVVAHLGPRQGVKLVKRLAHHLGSVECLEYGQVEDERGGCFAAGPVVEDEFAFAGFKRLTWLLDHYGRRQQANAGPRRILAKAVVHLAGGLRGRCMPYRYCPRRPITTPFSPISLATSPMKPVAATAGTLRSCIFSAYSTPSAPPKWSG